MDPKNQLDYNGTSKRANAAVRTARGGQSGPPDRPDDGSVRAPAGADQPSDQHTGGAVKRNDQKSDQSFEQPSGGRAKVEKG